MEPVEARSGARSLERTGPLVYVVDDEADIAQVVGYNLQRDGYRSMLAADGEALFELLGERPCDLIVLDLMLPGMSGFEICRRLKSNPATRDIPVLMLTARGEEADMVAGLELGAEDYVTKPFSPRVLLARIGALLRRRAAQSEDESPIRHGALEIDPARYSAKLDGEELDLTLTELRMLQALARRPGRVLTRKELLMGSVGGDVVVLERTVDVHIGSLRKKLGRNSGMIETVRGVGYRLTERP